MKKKRNLHRCFEQTFDPHVGEQFRRAQMVKMLQGQHTGFPDGSVVPTDDAEPSPEHVNQRKKCSEARYQIFDTVDRHGDNPVYRVSAFQPS